MTARRRCSVEGCDREGWPHAVLVGRYSYPQSTMFSVFLPRKLVKRYTVCPSHAIDKSRETAGVLSLPAVISHDQFFRYRTDVVKERTAIVQCDQTTLRAMFATAKWVYVRIRMSKWPVRDIEWSAP